MAENERLVRRAVLIRNLFDLLLESDESNGMSASSALSRLAERVSPLTPYEAADYPSHPGRRRFESEVRFATIPVVKAGWLYKEKGRWQVTADGLTALKKYPDPVAFRTEAKHLYAEWKADQPILQIRPEEEEKKAEVLGSLEEAQDAAVETIRGYLQQMGPYDFQKLVAALLRSTGHHVLWVAPPGPDKGIDILASTDALGVERPRLKVQVKRHADAVRVQDVRAFQAVLGEHDVGIFVNTGGFTAEAASEARTHAQHPVTVLDSDDIVQLWIEHQDSLEPEARELLPLQPVYFLHLPE